MSSKWPEKYVIGLTGNIATGKSVVRKMLEHLGAYGIDADGLSHRATAKGAPGYQATIDAFGKWILAPDGEIDRVKLGKLAFGDPEAMSRLETIVHPLVLQAIDIMIKRATQRVIVIEAIKLLESDLYGVCDAIWVVNVPEDLQAKRLVEKRGLSAKDATERVHFQNSQEKKLAAAQIIIQNIGSFEDTWKQVAAEWKKVVPQADAVQAETVQVVKPGNGEFLVARGRPRDSASIADLVTRLSGKARTLTQDDVMAAFGEKAFMLLQQNGKNVGVAGWQVENLVARTTEFFVDPSVSAEEALKILILEVERASSDLQCEASLLFLPTELATHQAIWKQLGYEPRTPQSLGVQASLFFKQLRQDRVLRPI